MADRGAIIDDLLDHAREMAEEGHCGVSNIPNAIEIYLGIHKDCVAIVESALDTREKFHLVYKSLGVIHRLDKPLAAARKEDFGGECIVDHWRQRPVFVSITDLGEHVEAVIPSLVWFERPKVRQRLSGHFLR